MRKIGISIYPEHSTKEKDFAYMEKAARYGFTRIFTCLLSVKKEKEEIIKELKEYTKKAHDLGFKIAVDTNPEVFKHLGASAIDLSPFAKMNIDMIRLDMSFGAIYDTFVSENSYGIEIEFNGSNISDNVEAMLHMKARKDRICICHNFYPQKYTGLDYDLFTTLSKKWKDIGFVQAAFVTSQNTHTYGPWPVYAGLPTLEMHRNLAIDVQARHLFSTGVIDDVIIGNAYASDMELKALSELHPDVAQIRVQPFVSDEITNKLLYESKLHFRRFDCSNYMVRSSLTRTAKDVVIEPIPCDAPFFHKGDVCIVNSNLPRYCGEVQLILQDILNDGERNLVGHICEDELCILDEIKPWQRFELIR